MGTVLVGTSRILARGRMLQHFERLEVPTRIAISAGTIQVHTEPWERFWRPVLALGADETAREVEALHRAWSTYVRSGLLPQFAQEYCFRYFTLLESILRLCGRAREETQLRAALQAVLGFECMGVFDSGGDRPVAAGTTTLRNPCYLLARLKHPSALDDPQFLPLVVAPIPPPSHCFYHYRQHKLSIGSGLSLLLYLNPGDRRSFPAVNAIEAGICVAADPRADERAERISTGILIPYLASQARPANCAGQIEIVDVGSGSGLLVSKLLLSARRAYSRGGAALRVRAYLLDVAPSDPVRFFRTPGIRTVVDTLTCISGDYRDWLSRPHRLPSANGFRVAIVCRFFNNFSNFGIRAIDPGDMAEMAGLGPTRLWWPACTPAECLKPGAAGPDSLVISSRRTWLDAGRTFVQASLSPFFEGLDWLMAGRGRSREGRHDADRILAPIRSFQQRCLLTSRGRSVLAELLADCGLVVVSDTDMRPNDLLCHHRNVGIPHSSGIDMTRPLRLKGHFTYAVVRSGDPAIGQLKGDRLW